MGLTPNLTDSFDIQLNALERDQRKRSKSGTVDFWRQRVPKLDERRRIIKGGMWKPQQDWWNLPTFVKAFVAGYGAGKSMILCKRAIASALHNSGCMVALVSPTFAMARRTTIRTLLELLEGKRRLLGDRFWYRYNGSKHEVTIKYNGRVGIIIILSGEDPIALKGSNLAAAYLDEPFIMDEEVFTQMVSRVRHPDAQLEEICLAGTPEQLNWGYTLCRGKKVQAFEEMEEPLSVAVVNGSTIANEALKPDYVKRLLARLTPEAAKAYVNGVFVNLTQGRVYYGFDEDSHVHSAPIPESAELGVGMDFNVTPMAAVVFWKKRNHIHIFEEILLDNSDTFAMCEELRSKPYSNRLHDVFPDPTGKDRQTNSPHGKTDFHFLEEAGFTVHAPYNPYNMKDTLNIVNGKFRPADKSTPSISIEPSCTKLIENLNAYSHTLKNKQEHMKHLLDAFRYPIANLFPLPYDRAGESQVHGA